MNSICISLVIVIVALGSSCVTDSQRKSEGFSGVLPKGFDKSHELQNMVGLLYTKGEGVLCAAYRSAPFQISTAKTCFKKQLKKLYRFSDGKGRTSEVLRVVEQSVSGGWVVLELTQKDFQYHLGVGPVEMGPLTLVSPSETEGVTRQDPGMDKTWLLKGINLSGIESEKCEVLAIHDSSKTFAHDCSTFPAGVGSPLIQHGLVVGMHMGLVAQEGLDPQKVRGSLNGFSLENIKSNTEVSYSSMTQNFGIQTFFKNDVNWELFEKRVVP